MNAKPSTAAPPPVDISAYDPALIAAWRRFLDYDLASSRQKELHQRTRLAIILLSLFTSIGAVLSIYATAMPFSTEVFQSLMRVGLIIMPIASVALMNYAMQFATSTGWIEYRVSAELIRSQIYLYRLDMPPYRDLDKYQRRARLLTEVASIDHWMRENNLSMPQMQVIGDANLITRIRGKTEGAQDDGFGPVMMNDYVNGRVRGQFDWYTGKIETDYQTMRNNRIAAIVVASVGSVLAGIGGGLEGLVGITTAVGVALTMISDVRMYGRTYRLYHEAAMALNHWLNQWNTLPPEERERRADEFVVAFEKVFDNERRRWREDTIRTQISTEQAITNQIQQVAGSQADNLLAEPTAASAVIERPSLFDGGHPAETRISVEVPGEVRAEVSHVGGSPAEVSISGDEADVDGRAMAVEADEDVNTYDDRSLLGAQDGRTSTTLEPEDTERAS